MEGNLLIIKLTKVTKESAEKLLRKRGAEYLDHQMTLRLFLQACMGEYQQGEIEIPLPLMAEIIGITVQELIGAIGGSIVFRKEDVELMRKIGQFFNIPPKKLAEWVREDIERERQAKKVAEINRVEEIKSAMMFDRSGPSGIPETPLIFNPAREGYIPPINENLSEEKFFQRLVEPY